jgi:zinc transport system substrate-binding protein
VHSRFPPEDFHCQGEVDGSVDVEKWSAFARPPRVIAKDRYWFANERPSFWLGRARTLWAEMKHYNIPIWRLDMRRSNRVLTGLAMSLAAWSAFVPAPGRAEIDVVASIKPVHSLVAGVMEGVGEPVLLVKGASSPHGYSLRPSDAWALDEAHVVFWIGQNLETYLTKPLQALSAAALVVPLSEAEGVRLLPAREGGVWVEHEHQSRGAQTQGGQEGDRAHVEVAEAVQEQPEQEGGGPTPEHGRFDMHIWLDPHNAEAMVNAIIAALSDADPANTSSYRDNGGEVRRRLKQLDETLSTELAAVADRPFVVFHDAYQYLEERYGLHAIGTISIDPGRRPGAQRLSRIQHSLNQLDAACVFAEPQFEPALVDTVIEGTSARKGVLDPLGADLEAGAEQYFQLMYGLADSLIACLGEAK